MIFEFQHSISTNVYARISQGSLEGIIFLNALIHIFLNPIVSAKENVVQSASMPLKHFMTLVSFNTP